jgi:hypothetical protein
MKPEPRAAIEDLTFARRGIYWQVSSVVIGKRSRAIELAMKYLGMLGQSADGSREALESAQADRGSPELARGPGLHECGRDDRG